MRGNMTSLRRSIGRRRGTPAAARVAARNRTGGLALAEFMEARRLLAVAVQDLGVAVPDDVTTAVVGDTLYFPARTAEHGVELWRSDGTVAGTRLVKDLLPGPNGSLPNQFTALGDAAYFVSVAS